MSAAAINQSVYAPLRQNFSDSESDEEFRLPDLIGHEVKIEPQQRNGLDHSKYYSTDEDANVARNEDGDNVALLRKDISLLRKLMFVFSILFCFLTVILFLWVLPCDESLKCTAKIKRPKQMAWEIPYHDIEFKGPINVVNSAVGNGKSVILLYRGNILKSDENNNMMESTNNGIILIVGDTGKVGWFIPQQRLPSDIDCSLIDVNKDGINDCIVVGSEGLFAVLNPFSGAMLWYLHNNEGSESFGSVDFPLLIMDLDNDNVPDLLTSCSQAEHNHNSLIIVSGQKGSIIGQPLHIPECTSIHKLQIDKDSTVSFTCKNNTSSSESLKVFSLQNLCQDIINKSVGLIRNWIVPDQHPLFGQRRDVDNQRNIYTIANKKLVIENRGRYPKYSKVTVQLFNIKNGKDSVIWDYHANRVYGMVPAIINFNRYKDESKHITGFVLKFWQWISVKGPKNTKQSNTTLDNVTVMKTPRDSLSYHRLSERVVLVTFNETDFHIVNATQSDVIQVCQSDLTIDSICQPDMRYQENSLLITDLDSDGSQELVSYLTTFKAPDGEPADDILNKTRKHLKLTSTLRVIRLESELPKLYEAVSHR